MANQLVTGLVGAALGVAVTAAVALAVRNTPDECSCPAVAQPKPDPEPQPQPPPTPQPQPPPRPIDPSARAEAEIDTGTDVAVTCHLDEVACLLADQPPACCSVYGRPPRGIASTTLTATQVRTTVQPLRGRIARCGTGPSGTVKIRVQVANDGTVSRVDVLETPDDAVAACVAQVMRGARFPRSDDGVSFTYPFVF